MKSFLILAGVALAAHTIHPGGTRGSVSKGAVTQQELIRNQNRRVARQEELHRNSLRGPAPQRVPDIIPPYKPEVLPSRHDWMKKPPEIHQKQHIRHRVESPVPYTFQSIPEPLGGWHHPNNYAVERVQKPHEVTPYGMEGVSYVRDGPLGGIPYGHPTFVDGRQGTYLDPFMVKKSRNMTELTARKAHKNAREKVNEYDTYMRNIKWRDRDPNKAAQLQHAKELSYNQLFFSWRNALRTDAGFRENQAMYGYDILAGHNNIYENKEMFKQYYKATNYEWDLFQEWMRINEKYGDNDLSIIPISIT